MRSARLGARVREAVNSEVWCLGPLDHAPWRGDRIRTCVSRFGVEFDTLPNSSQEILGSPSMLAAMHCCLAVVAPLSPSVRPVRPSQFPPARRYWCGCYVCCGCWGSIGTRRSVLSASATAKMLRAAFSSRSRMSPQSMPTCVRLLSVFRTSAPQPEHAWLV